jgi:hypothetical protein
MDQGAVRFEYLELSDFVALLWISSGSAVTLDLGPMNASLMTRYERLFGDVAIRFLQEPV